MKSKHAILKLPYSEHCITYIIVLLVGLVWSIRVSNLALQVVVVLGFEVLNAFPVTPLGVSIDIHLDNTIANSLLDIRDIRSASTVEHKVDGLLVLRGLVSKLFANVGLCLIQNLGV